MLAMCMLESHVAAMYMGISGHVLNGHLHYGMYGYHLTSTPYCRNWRTLQLLTYLFCSETPSASNLEESTPIIKEINL